MLFRSLRFGLPITNELSFNPYYTIESKEISNYKDYNLPTAALSIKQAVDEGRTLKSAVGYNLVFNTIDNMQDPHSGVYVKFGQEVAGLGGDVKFARSTVDARYYHDLYPAWGLVGLVKVGAGHIQGIGGDDVRILDAFFKGPDAVRGFKPGGYGPRDITSGDSIGGKTFVNATAEVQFPLPYLDTFGLRGSVFADAGTLFNSDVAKGTFHNDRTIRSSVGAGVIWNSPFGLIRMDYAHALTKENYDETQVFRFGAASQF